MNRLLASAVLVVGLAGGASATDAQSGAMTVVRAAPSTALAPAEQFTGRIHAEPIGKPVSPARANSSAVTFAPAARSYWHSHPAGQTLIVTAGEGWVQVAGQPPRRIRTGDVIWTPPGVKHWHGATATGSMTHVAVQETVGGANVTWAEPVSDAQYAQAK